MKQILLVDDESIFHFLNSKILSISNVACEVKSAYDGKEAMGLLSSGYHPDYIFLDLDMPHMNGYQFIEAFAKSPVSNKAAVRIVVLTSSETDEERKRVKALGVSDYIAKPLTEQAVKDLGL